ncbi:MAG: rhodanese-like domain-containing protein [Gammaproteobacteria bacterium]|nr:rhodanese-like domain-containing protein [Gammaproteobacteria bacterium]
MDKILEFANASPYLLTATVLMLIAVVAFELRLRARASFEVSIPETIRMINNGATVVDVRDAALFAAGHIVEAVNIPTAELVKGEEGKIKKKRAIVVVCENGTESLQCVRKLRVAGFDGAFSLGSGLEGWRRDNHPLFSGKR